MTAEVSAPLSPAPTLIRPTPTRGVWGPLLVATITEVLILAGAALWLMGRPSASPPISPAWGPLQLDLTKPATPGAGAGRAAIYPRGRQVRADATRQSAAGGRAAPGHARHGSTSSARGA